MTTLAAINSPHRVQRTWDLHRSAPTNGLKDLTCVRVRTRYALEVGTSDGPMNGHGAQPAGGGAGELSVEARTEMTVGELKARVAHHLHITPRKVQRLDWWGLELGDDSKTLGECRIGENGLLQLSLRSRTQKELEPLKQLTQVRVRHFENDAVAITDLEQNMTVGSIKELLKMHKVRSRCFAEAPSLARAAAAPGLSLPTSRLTARCPRSHRSCYLASTPSTKGYSTCTTRLSFTRLLCSALRWRTSAHSARMASYTTT